MIYKLQYKDIRKKLMEFNKTVYGKSVFVICYSPFVLFFVTSILGLYLTLTYHIHPMICILPFLFLATFLSFCIGSYAFYKEFRIFVNKV